LSSTKISGGFAGYLVMKSNEPTRLSTPVILGGQTLPVDITPRQQNCFFTVHSRHWLSGALGLRHLARANQLIILLNPTFYHFLGYFNILERLHLPFLRPQHNTYPRLLAPTAYAPFSRPVIPCFISSRYYC